MILKVLILFVVVAAGNVANAKGYCGDCLKLNSDGKTHPYFKLILKAVDQAQEQAEKSKISSAVISLSAQASPSVVFNHYKGLMGDIGSLIETNNGNDVGTSSNGYKAVRMNLGPVEVSDLLKVWPSAIAKYLKSNHDVQWVEYVKFFGGDVELALKSILVTDQWIRGGMSQNWDYSSSIVKWDNELNETNGVAFEGRLWAPYGAGYKSLVPGFKEPLIDPLTGSYLRSKLFGLTLTKDKNGGYYGSQYKIIAGMNMAMALWYLGYSDDDILFSVDRMNLVYETSDLLYDHLKLSRTDIYQCLDNTDLAPAGPDFARALDKIAEEIQIDGKLAATLAGHLFGFPNIVGILPGAKAFGRQLTDPLKLTMALLSYYKSDKVNAWKLISKYLPEFQAKKIQTLFEAGARDIKNMNIGAQFSVEKLGAVPKYNVKFHGVVRGLRLFDQFLDTKPRSWPRL